MRTFRKILREFIQRLFLVLFSTGCMTLVAYGFELWLKHSDPRSKLPQNGVIDGATYTWGHRVINNRYGFRERDFSIPKPLKTFRVMVLGDSLTWGVGLSVEQRYTNLTEHLLQKQFPEKRIEVLNFAEAGTATTRQKSVLVQYRDLVQPDLIVVGFCLNDPQPREQNWSIEREQLANKLTSYRYCLGGLSLIGMKHISGRLSTAPYVFAEAVGYIPDWQTALQRTYEV